MAKRKIASQVFPYDDNSGFRFEVAWDGEEVLLNNYNSVTFTAAEWPILRDEIEAVLKMVGGSDT